MTELADLVAARDAQTRYELTISLLQTLIVRIARIAATGTRPPPVERSEAALWDVAARHPAQAAPWAETLAEISQTTRHALAVNLDPGQCVIDTLLRIDDTLSRVRSVAA